jgi:hypothetical protein
MDPAARYQETLRRLAILDEELITAGFGLDLASASRWISRPRRCCNWQRR